MAMRFSEPTSHGFTFKDSKIVCGSVGASIAVLGAIGLATSARDCALILEATGMRGTRGPSSCEGETFLRLRDAEESRESESESYVADRLEDTEPGADGKSSSSELSASRVISGILCGAMMQEMRQRYAPKNLWQMEAFDITFLLRIQICRRSARVEGFRRLLYCTAAGRPWQAADSACAKMRFPHYYYSACVSGRYLKHRLLCESFSNKVTGGADDEERLEA